MRTIAFMFSAALAVHGADPAQAQLETEGETETETEFEVGHEPEVEVVEGGYDAGCLAEPVVLRRVGAGEPLAVSLTDCEQRPNPAALPLLSALAAPATKSDTEAAMDEARPLNPALLVRLQRVAAHFPGHTIEIVSGFRPRARPGSRHRSGDAIDVHIEGIDNATLSEFVRTLEDTGVGYYPNSTFVHIDVREAAAYWVDLSGPGEKPKYVRPSEAHGPELPVQSVDEVEEMAQAEAAPELEPPQASDEPEPDPAALQAELENIAQRALIVMRQAGSANTI